VHAVEPNPVPVLGQPEAQLGLAPGGDGVRGEAAIRDEGLRHVVGQDVAAQLQHSRARVVDLHEVGDAHVGVALGAHAADLVEHDLRRGSAAIEVSVVVLLADHLEEG
jgi:hypothetical protein